MSREDQTYELKFSNVQAYARPTYQDKDRVVNHIYPNEARLRNLTYELPVYMDVSFRILSTDEHTLEENVLHEHKDNPRLPIGKIPVMVRSDWCALKGLTDKDCISKGECFYDQGGYFIIKGGEKVVVAQEKMANNFVYVFRTKGNSAFSWQAEIRSYVDESNKPPSKFSLN